MRNKMLMAGALLFLAMYVSSCVVSPYGMHRGGYGYRGGGRASHHSGHHFHR